MNYEAFKKSYAVVENRRFHPGHKFLSIVCATEAQKGISRAGYRGQPLYDGRIDNK